MSVDENERNSLLRAVRLEVDGAISESTKPLSANIARLQESVDGLRRLSDERETRLTNEVASIREEFRRTRDVAEAASRKADSAAHEISTAYDAMKAHAKVVEKQIAGFDGMLRQVGDENRVQTETLTELASAAVERERRGQETKAAVERVEAQLSTISAAEAERQKKEMVREALEKKDAERRETFWKRLPIFITLAIVLSGVIFWLLNSIIIQNRINNGLPPVGNKSPAPASDK